MARKRGAAIRAKKYERFCGVDFSTDPALVDDSRSPWAPNMVADKGGMPEKRPGWRTLRRFDGRVNGLYRAAFDELEHFFVHAGTKLWRYLAESGTEPTLLAEGLPDERSTAVYMGGRLWIFTGAKLLRCDGASCVDAAEAAYVPTTLIARSPAGGGVRYESANLLTGKQRVRFLADGTSTTYRLPYTGLDSVDEVTVDGEAASGWTADVAAGTVTFASAPAAPSAGAEDNVSIAFTKAGAGHAERIGKCRAATVWGVGGASDRIVASGNPDCPNMDFTCGFGDGTYWPDDLYAVVGAAETAIVGYRRLGECLAVVKEDNGQEPTVFLRSGSLDADGRPAFATRACLSGAGGVTRFGFGSIGDEQLILTGGGVYALTTDSLTAERIVQNRSYYVDPRLTNEELRNAVTCSYDESYLVFVGGRVYGLNGRQRSRPSRGGTTFLYECFYWENVPARCVLRVVGAGGETLYFGTEDGRVCRFNTDLDGVERFNDDGAAIEAIWSTRADDDGDPMVRKTLLKEGNAVTIKPYSRSSAKILFRTDRDAVARQAAEGAMDIFSWEDIDFSRFTFNANDAPQEIPFRTRIKNYKRLQIQIKNDAVNEGFGVYAVVKHYAIGSFSKK